MKLLTTIIACSLLLLSCNNKPGPAHSGTNSTSAQAELPYPPMPVDGLKQMFDEVDYIDYIIYNLPISMNQAETAAIRTTISNIETEASPVYPNCPSIGRVFFMVDGENKWEADLHIAEGCAYYMFLEDGKPKYSNKITPVGLTFYQNIFQNFQN